MFFRIIRPSFFSFLLIAASCRPASAADYDTFSSGLRMLWGLLVVLAIMFAIYTVLRKRVSTFNQHGKGQIKIVEIKHIPPKKSLMLIEVRGREYLVGGSHDAINTIVPLSQTASFSSILDHSKETLQS